MISLTLLHCFPTVAWASLRKARTQILKVTLTRKIVQAQTGYQQPAYSQPAAYGQQTSYQQPAAASTYNYQAQSTPQQQAYGQTANTYSQQYAAPQQAAATYTNPTATTAYGTATTGSP